jgi:UDP-N-acetylglucosamine 2-epimerase (non-hydrolysing)
MKKVMVIFGTRPEAIKMGPVVLALKARSDLQTVVCVTGQHREMLKQVLDCFEIEPEYDLAIMRERQTLFDITRGILASIGDVLEKEKPDLVLVHGDTTTTFASALAAFYLKIPVGHVEAGLRTHDLNAPFPEEFHRKATSIVAALNFAPTQLAKQNLLNEGYDETTVFVTGNTAIDALKTTVRDSFDSPLTRWIGESRLILLTAHRRESFGEPLKNIFRAIRRIVDDMPDVK